MQILGENLRTRARELELSDAEVARRADLSTRRYGHYVTGDREPDLQTLLRICDVLSTTPNDLLGLSGNKRKATRQKLMDKLVAAANALDDDQLRLAVRQIEVILKG